METERENEDLSSKNSLEEERELDLDWRQQQNQNLASNLLEEAKLKQLVIQRELEAVQKQEILNLLKEDYFSYFNLLSQESNSVTLNLTDYETFCVTTLEKRIQYLNQRAEKLQTDLNEFSQKIAEENQDAYPQDDLNANLQRQLNETLYENKTLEKYIRSENFRIYDETIGALKFNLDLLLVKKKEMREVRVVLVQSEEKKKLFLAKLQKKYRKLNVE